MTYPTIPVEVQHRRWIATAKHHERMAAIFNAAGRLSDAEAAGRAAEQCLRSAERVAEHSADGHDDIDVDCPTCRADAAALGMALPEVN